MSNFRLRPLCLLPAILLSSALSGCSTLLAVDEQHEKIDANAVLGGKVATVGYEARGALIVAVVERGSDGYVMVDHFVAERPGAWVLPVTPGTYWVAAFEDVNGNGRYDDEPAYRPDDADAIALAPGQRLGDLDIRIEKSGRFHRKTFALEDAQARKPGEQTAHSLFALCAVGEPATLDDPSFSEANARVGMWRPYDFFLASRPGVYFLETYDPGRIPVLFVHGVGGTPIHFREIIAGLDRKRFQPWVVFYPSGSGLDNLGTWLAQLFARLRVKYRFERAAVVAHSMGGLVSRAFLLDDFGAAGKSTVRTFVTISSPLGGMVSAGKGVERSPVVLRNWYGLAPGSNFLDGLFYSDVPARRTRRTLPAHVEYHMMFGYRGDGGDGVVTLASQLRSEAQSEARSLRGYDETHNGILVAPAVSARLNEILAGMR